MPTAAPSLDPDAPGTLRSLAPAAACAAMLAAGRALPLPGADGRIAHLPSVCLFHALTGLPCPGCGLTRSVVCAMHGRWEQAFSYHPLGLLVCAAAAAVIGRAVCALVWPRRHAAWTTGAAARPRWAGAATLAVLLACWAARLAGWDPLPG